MRDTARMNSTESTDPITADEIVETTVPIPAKQTYSVAEAAAILGVSRPTIYRLIARRILVPIPGLRHKRLPKKQVRRLTLGAASIGFY